MKKHLIIAAAALLGAASLAHAEPASCGRAAWYEYTTRTASGEMGNPRAMTAAHRTLPFGTKVKVTNLRNGRSVVVRINDRGPYTKGRVIDLTRAAAEKLGYINAGTAPVALTFADDPAGKPVPGCPR
ncbi:septal ring lytic transglycosylase RlpA family protein [Breoghania sp.]|uniref:septal ring lytic transglycosylase RlpA family protein n=1 Tax=Breoghania sp. TaxID=2065378 RepID=UPI002AA89CAD|nr:septal ring lytic transglycosylase RlpA family protein [Breoghania sp.]